MERLIGKLPPIPSTTLGTYGSLPKSTKSYFGSLGCLGVKCSPNHFEFQFHFAFSTLSTIDYMDLTGADCGKANVLGVDTTLDKGWIHAKSTVYSNSTCEERDLQSLLKVIWPIPWSFHLHNYQNLPRV
jgi:hypothetical protein